MARTRAGLLSLFSLLVPSVGRAQDVTCPTTDCASLPLPCDLGTPPPNRNGSIVAYHPRENLGECNPNGTCDDPRADCNANNRCIIVLKGAVWVPDGPGPFPAVILNHGSVGCDSSNPLCTHNPLQYYHEAEKYFFDHGYVVFAPSRRGYNPSTGTYIDDLITRQMANGADCNINGQQDCMTFDLYNEVQDVIDAYDWLRTQPYVDKNRLAVLGHSLGGIVTMFWGMGGFVGDHRVTIAIAPGAESWCAKPVLRDMLLFAADHQFVPTYVFDTLNDISIRPVTEIAHEMGITGHIYQSGLFAKVVEDGEVLTCGADAHACFAFDPTYVDRWGPTVLAFMHRFGVK